MKYAYTIACAIVNLSIEKSCITNLRRLHKLLYFAQCYSLAKYNTPLFVEDVIYHDCGPYVEALSSFYGDYGIGAYTEPIDHSRLSSKELDAVRYVVLKYKETLTPKLILSAKQSKPYLNAENHGSVISMDDMKAYGLTVLKIRPISQSPLDVASYVRETQELQELIGHSERHRRSELQKGYSAYQKRNMGERQKKKYGRKTEWERTRATP